MNYTVINHWAVLTGVCVLGQSGFPANTVINCYGNDATCTGSFTSETEDELFYNVCCFTMSDRFDPFSISALNPGYYSVAGGPCQSCMGKNDCCHYRSSLYVCFHA